MAAMIARSGKYVGFFHRTAAAGLAIALLCLPAPGGITARAEPPRTETPHAESRPAARQPVVVELFTSQGCSSCMESNAVIGRLAERSDILPLTFHVDYWDYMGWADPFGNRAFTERQRNYALSFGRRYLMTPEIIIDGYEDVRATNFETLARLVERARSSAEGRVRVSLALNADGYASVNIGAGSADGRVTIWLVNFDRRVTTPVRAGENNGLTVTTYNVVTRLTYLGSWSGGALDLRLSPDRLARNRAGGAAIVLQAERMGRIAGAAAVLWNDGAVPAGN